MKKITRAELQRLLHYDPLTGIFTWKVLFSGCVPGDIAGGVSGNRWTISIYHADYAAGALAWFYVTGKWPTKEVDHKNRNYEDNRWENLREGTRSQNGANRAKFIVGASSRFKGVSLRKDRGLWRAMIKVNNQPLFLGHFVLEEAAAIAYELAAHKHFGEFAVLNFPNASKRDWILV